MSEVLRKCEALGIESDIIDRGKRLNALTVLKMQRRIELAQLASSTDLDELETQVINVYFIDAFFVCRTPTIFRLNEPRMKTFKRLPSLPS
jgi:hypothetical protein